MKTLRSLSTRRVAFLSGLALLIGLCAWTALAGSIPANLTINFDGLGFVDNTNTMTNVFTSGDFTFTVSASDWIQGAGAFCDGGSGGCLNASGSGLETITIQTTSGNVFDFMSFWDLNICQSGIVQAQGFLNTTLVATQTTGFPVDSMACGGTSATVTMNGFRNINKIVFTSSGSGFADNLDTFVFNAITAPGAPTIGTATAGNTQASVTFTAPASDGGANITGYTVTASPGGATGTGTTSPITVNGLINGTTYSFTVTATNAIGTGTASAASNSVTPVAPQTITFANPGTQNFGTAPTLTATATSGLTVTFSSSTTAVCTITSGGLLTFITSGTCTIIANQSGNVAFGPAPPVSQSFSVAAIVPGAPTIGTATAGNSQATVTFTAPASSGGATITGYTVTSNPGGLTGTGASSPITVVGLTNGTAYTFTVTATNSAGTGGSSAASNSVTPAASQTITFANPGPLNFGTTPTLTATATSSLTVAFTSSTTAVCTITTGGLLTFVAVGSCSINANQAGNSAFLAAPQVSQTFSVAGVVPAAPTIGTATAGNAQASVTFTPPAFTGGSAISGFTATSSPGGFTGAGTSSPIVVTGLTNGTAYTFTVTATNGTGTGAPSAASNSVTPSNTQTITFTNPGSQNFGSTPTLIATATSGLTVVFTSLTPGVCTITSGGTLTFTGTGTCTINANQPGNGTVLAAPQVSQTFSVVAVAPGAPGLVTATAGNAQASVSFVAPVSNGGSPITLYTITSNPGGITKSGVSSPITVTGLANGTTYSFTVTATNSAGTGPASTPSNSVTPGANIVQGGSISAVSGSGQTGALGTPFAAPLVVLVEDGSGAPIANATVSFNVITGLATLNPAFATTGSDGTAQIKATPTASGVITIWGTVSGVSGAAVFVETGLSSTTSQLSVLPSALTFTAVQGGGNPLPASIAVSNTGTGNLPWTASASGSPSWLTLSPASGGTPAVITASINTTGLPAGSYQSTVAVTSGSQQQTIGVSLTVQPSTPAQFTLTPPAVVVNASVGSATPVSQSISVANAGSGALAWTAVANTGAASGWLSITSAASGAAPATVAVQVNPTGLAAGQYLGNISFSAQGVAPSSVAVILNVTALPDLTSTVPVLEFRGPVGSSFSSQTLPVTTTTGGSVSFTATPTLPAGMSWLSISGGSGGTPASIAASVNTSGLAVGYYVGYILVQSSGARNTLAVPVVLDLGGAAPSGTLSASPGGVLLTGQSGTLTQTVTLSSDAAPFSWNASTPASTGSWLSVSPGSGSGNGPITVTANLAGLSPGSYSGQVAITSASTSNAQLIVPVTLIVSSATAVTSTNTLQTVAPAGDFIAPLGIPLELQASILSPIGTPVTGGSVQVSFSSGDAAVTLTDAGGGLYSGVWTPLQAGPVSLIFTAANATTGVVTGVVSVPAGKQPAVPKNGAVGGASFTIGMPLAVGSISTLFGQNLSSQTATAASLPLSASLGGTSVTINGIAAPLFYVSPTQINFFVPYELAGQTTATIAVSTSGGIVELSGVPIIAQAPGIFELDSAGDAAALHSNGTVVSSAAPASSGEVVELFATGLGPVSNVPADGAAAPSGTLANDQIAPAVTIGGVNAQVNFAGLAPGFVGLYQINVTVPSGLPAGPAAVTISVGPLSGNSAILQVN